MTITASGVYMDVGILYQQNIFQSRSFFYKIVDILINLISTCSYWASKENGLPWRCASRSSLLYSGFRYTIELPLQPQNPVVYLSGARVSIFLTLVTRLYGLL